MENKDFIESFIKNIQSSLKYSTPNYEVETITCCGIKNLVIRFFVEDISQYDAFDCDRPNILKAAFEDYGDNYVCEAGSIEFWAPVAEIMPDGSVQKYSQTSDKLYNSWCRRQARLNAELDMAESNNKTTSQEVVENTTDVRDDKTIRAVAGEVLHNSNDRNIILCASLAAALITLGMTVANEYSKNRQYYEDTTKSRRTQVWKATKSVSKKPKTWLKVAGATLFTATFAFAWRVYKRG